MAVSIDKFWIEGVLTEAFPRFLEASGIDLDKNGQIEGGEVFGDLDGDGTIGNPDDYKEYLRRNRPLLSAEVPFFKYGERLSIENRIHRTFYLLSDIHPETDIASAYTFIADLVETVEKKIGEEKWPAMREAQFYYQAMRGAGLVIKTQYMLMSSLYPSLVGNIKAGQLDCDTSSLVAMAIGDERGVSLRGVRSPHHFFLRGRGEDGKEFNIDFGMLTTDTDYEIEPDSLLAKIYLATLNDRQLESYVLQMRGRILENLKRYKEALAACDKAVSLESNDPFGHLCRAGILGKQGRHKEATIAIDKAFGRAEKIKRSKLKK